MNTTRFLVRYLIEGLEMTSQVWARNELEAKRKLREQKSPFGYATIAILSVRKF